ncbi:MAG: hypothetical protein WB245_02505 [Acidimicrobiia bacterium]
MENTKRAWWSPRWVWWTAFALAVFVGTGTIAVALTGGTTAIAYLLASAVWTPLGLLVWRRRPTHPIGPLLFLVGILNLIVIPGFMMGALLAQFEATITPHPLAVSIFAAAAGAYSYAFLIPILLFPDGKPNGRAETVLVVLILTAGLAATATGLLAQPLHSVPHLFSPPGLASTSRTIYDALTQAYGLGLVAVAAIKISEFRRSESVRKTQLKWLIYVLTVYMLATFISFGIVGVEDFEAGGLWVDATFVALIPLAMALAILRYRLYEIDRLISRTVTYAAMFLLVAALFALPVLVLPTMIGRTSEIAVAGTTLVIAAIFAPIRSRLQSKVDKRFNRARFDTEREIAALAKKLNHTLSTEMLTEETVQLVARTLHPSSIGIWIKG